MQALMPFGKLPRSVVAHPSIFWPCSLRKHDVLVERSTLVIFSYFYRIYLGAGQIFWVVKLKLLFWEIGPYNLEANARRSTLHYVSSFSDCARALHNWVNFFVAIACPQLYCNNQINPAGGCDRDELLLNGRCGGAGRDA